MAGNGVEEIHANQHVTEQVHGFPCARFFPAGGAFMTEMEKEQQHLDEVCGYINGLLAHMGADIRDLKAYIREERARIWDDYAHDAPQPEDGQGVQQIVETEVRDVMRYERMNQLNESLILLADHPYFARLDVRDEFGTDCVYIGKRSLMDKDGFDMLVCDWRSDIASLFYDADLGPAHYQTDHGEINCELLLRRQFRTENGKILYLFDSDIAIEDDILKDELGKSSDTKLKTIISTLQREQSVIIRDLSADLVLVEGVAGSGKTSVALHRLAYLLYKFRKTLSSGNILLFTVNNVFSSYIADVLPDLGEDRVVQTGFYDYFKPYFEDWTVENGSGQAERIFSGESEREEVLRKGSKHFRQCLKYTFEELADSDIHAHDVVFYDTLLRSAEEIRHLYNTEYASYPPAVRRRKIRNGILAQLEEDPAFLESRRKDYIRKITENGSVKPDDAELEEEIQECWQREIRAVGEDVDAMLAVDVLKIYRAALERALPDLAGKTEERLLAKNLCYEDFAALIYLKVLCGEIPAQMRIRHLLIDEAQDNSPVIYAVFGLMFPEAKYTVVGDPQQAFVPYFSSLSEVARYFTHKKTERFFTLSKSYRSTAEINEYLHRQFGISAPYFERHGEAVQEIRASEKIPYLAKISAQKEKSIAIICKTEAESRGLSERLKRFGIVIPVLSDKDVLLPDRTVIVPSHLTKGLEFDEVFLADASPENWPTENDRRALYVCESRALHRLTVCREHEEC